MDDMLDKVATEILELLPAGVMLADATGAVVHANQAALDYMGIGPEELRELNIGGMFRKGSGSKDVMFRTRGEERITVRLSRMDLSNGCSAVFLTDITEVHQLQQELLKMDKLATVGELTSGIAHEIRNPLAGIKTTAQALKGEMPDGDHRVAYVSRIIIEIDRLSKLLTSFFDFAKPRQMSLSVCDIKTVLEDTVFMVQESARQNHVQVLEFYPSGQVRVRADSDMLQQVFMNVLLNAVQAMQGGGRMEVHLADRGTGVEIMVRDTGRGIPEDIRSRIFDPFFTTKPKGIGLGLSISYRLVKMHSGTISFVSGAHGTTCTITLPKVVAL